MVMRRIPNLKVHSSCGVCASQWRVIARIGLTSICEYDLTAVVVQALSLEEEGQHRRSKCFSGERGIRSKVQSHSLMCTDASSSPRSPPSSLRIPHLPVPSSARHRGPTPSCSTPVCRSTVPARLDGWRCNGDSLVPLATQGRRGRGPTRTDGRTCFGATVLRSSSPTIHRQFSTKYRKNPGVAVVGNGDQGCFRLAPQPVVLKATSVFRRH